MTRRPYLLSSLAMLSACAGPAVETAKITPVTPPAAWPSTTETVNSASLDDAMWWRGFGDPALDQLIEKALRNNQDIAIAGARVRQAQAQMSSARAALLPSLDAAISATDSRSVNPFGQPVQQTAAQPQLQASWEADLFGRLSDQQSAARSSWLASEAARDSIRLSVSAATARAYIQLLSLDARLDIAGRTLKARAETVALTDRRVKEGYAPRLELTQAQAEYQTAAELIPSLRQARRQLENQILLLAGEMPGEILTKGSLSALQLPQVAIGLPSDLLRRRPDIAQAEEQLVAADHSLTAERKRFLPQIRLTGAAGAAISSLLDNPITIWSVGGSILAPIFDGGRLRAAAEGAGGRRDEAAYVYQKAAISAFHDVDNALFGIQYADEQERASFAREKALSESYQLATNRYKAGYSSYLEQLDAQRGLLSAELQYIEAKANRLNARVALYQALGGGWSR